MNIEDALPIVAGLCIGHTTEAEDEAVDLVVEAARMWVNPNYYAAAKAVGWVNKSGAKETIHTIVAAALTPGDTEQ